MAEETLRKFLPGTPTCMAEWRRPALDFGFRFVAPMQVRLPTRRFEQSIQILGGRTIPVYAPKQLAEALREVDGASAPVAKR